VPFPLPVRAPGRAAPETFFRLSFDPLMAMVFWNSGRLLPYSFFVSPFLAPSLFRRYGQAKDFVFSVVILQFVVFEAFLSPSGSLLSCGGSFFGPFHPFFGLPNAALLCSFPIFLPGGHLRVFPSDANSFTFPLLFLLRDVYSPYFCYFSRTARFLWCLLASPVWPLSPFFARFISTLLILFPPHSTRLRFLSLPCSSRFFPGFAESHCTWLSSGPFPSLTTHSRHVFLVS